MTAQKEKKRWRQIIPIVDLSENLCFNSISLLNHSFFYRTIFDSTRLAFPILISFFLRLCHVLWMIRADGWSISEQSGWFVQFIWLKSCNKGWTLLIIINIVNTDQRRLTRPSVRHCFSQGSEQKVDYFAYGAWRKRRVVLRAEGGIIKERRRRDSRVVSPKKGMLLVSGSRLQPSWPSK